MMTARSTPIRSRRERLSGGPGAPLVEPLEPRALLSGSAAGLRAANFTFALAGTPGPDHHTLRLDPTGARIQIFETLNSPTPGPLTTPTYTVSATQVSTITLRTEGGDDSVTLDLSAGTPIPSMSLIVEAGAGADRFTLAGDGSAAVALAGSALAVNGRPVSLNGVESAFVAGGSSVTLVTPASQDALAIDAPAAGEWRIAGTSGGASLVPTLTLSAVARLTLDAAAHDAGNPDDTLSITSSATPGAALLRFLAGPGDNALTALAGAITLDNATDPAAPSFSLVARNAAELGLAGSSVPWRLGTLTVADAAKVTFSSPVGQGLRAAGLSITSAGTLDLADNALIVDRPTPSAAEALRAAIGSARNAGPGGPWSGPGLTSSAARAAPTSRTLAVSPLGLAHPAARPAIFSTQAIDAAALLVRTAAVGDLDLDGRVDAADYHRIDAGSARALPGSWNGDLDFSGPFASADDYLLLDAAFIAALRSPASAPAALPSSPAAPSPRPLPQAPPRRSPIDDPPDAQDDAILT